MSVEFFLTALIVVLAPGTGVLYTVAVGISRGHMASIAAAIGCTLGIIPHLLATILGLAALLHTSAMAYQLFKIIGLLYLLFLAWQTLREKGLLETGSAKSPAHIPDIILTGIFINVLNPKLSIFFLAFLPQFVSASSQQASFHLLGLGAIFMGMTFIIFAGYGYFASLMRTHVLQSPRFMIWLRRSFAGAFAALGLKLALWER